MAAVNREFPYVVRDPEAYSTNFVAEAAYFAVGLSFHVFPFNKARAEKRTRPSIAYNLILQGLIGGAGLEPATSRL